MTLANAITVLRIMTVPLLVVFLFAETEVAKYWAAALFLIAGVSDFLDGHLARSRDEVSVFGKLADPLADKLIVLTTVFALVKRSLVNSWLAIVLLVKEVVLILGGAWLFCIKRRVISASMPGKVAAVVLYAGIFLTILELPLGQVLIAIGIGISLMAGAYYLFQALTGGTEKIG
ncbi:MAG: CDP-alcohol phosphatidyltransferase family protein [Limnochordia bacterium]|jgi:CDP-diacylglycerol--glycerol-3-phosphate 3-phosphatidyltransferase|nr:CDP-alcohol phosphatidyltransferase family protein [Limnochordia bacterium]MDD2630338.1 CDP-alcohol phosphatidyltransferase family protein [Limnochordia bacterium]MDD4517908.1 CDP-alcohol phosphatidyltransferase family protein [Limnochordia bacterium]